MNRKIIVFILSVLFLISSFIAYPVQASKIKPEDLKPTFPPFPAIRAIAEVPKISKDQIIQRLNSTKNNIKLKENSLSVQSGNSSLTVWVDQSFSGISDGTEGSPYKDIFTAISTPNVDGLQLNIKPGIYDESSHDLIGFMKAKGVEFIGITSEKPVIKTEFVSCTNKIIILNNIKVIGKTTAFNCGEGVSLDLDDSDITSDDDVIKLGGNPLIIAKNTNLSASKKSLNLLDGAQVELKDSTLTGSVVTGDHLLLISERVKFKGSIYANSYPSIEITDGTVDGAISTLTNMLLSANELTLNGSLDVTDEAKIQLTQSHISDSIKAGEKLLLILENSDIQNNLMGGNQVSLEFNNGTINGQMNLLQDALVSLTNAKINKSINISDKASISLTGSQIGDSVTAGDDFLLVSDKTSIAGLISSKDRAKIDLKDSSVNNQIKLGNEAFISANNTQFSLTINGLNKTLLSLTSSKMKQIMLGDESLIAIDKSIFKCSDSSKNGISTGARNELWMQNSIINGCNKAIDVLGDTTLSITLSTITNISSDAISYHGNLKLLQDSEGNTVESFHIENSIFSNITGYVANLSNYDPNISPRPKAKIYYNDFWQTQDLSQGIKEFCDSCTPNYNLDPLFKNSQTDDFHLLPNSQAIDAGNPNSDYSQEPIPNGGRVDLGAYGNTSETTSISPTQHLIFHTSFSGHIPDSNQELATTGSVPYNIKLVRLRNDFTEEPVPNADLILSPERYQIGHTNAEGILTGRLPIPELLENTITKEFIIETTLQGTDHIFSNPTLFYKGTLESNFSLKLTQEEIDLYTDKKIKDLFFNPSLPCPGRACDYLQLIDIMVNLFIEDPHKYNPKVGDVVGFSIVKYEVPDVPVAYRYNQRIQRSYKDFTVVQEDTWWSENRSHFPSDHYIARNALIVEVASPVTLLIKDPQGNEAGYDPQTGQYKFDFPIYISKVGSEPYQLIVPNPQKGSYSLSVTGTDQGSYTMTTYSLDTDGNKTSSTVIKDTTSKSQLTHYVLDVSNTSEVRVESPITINDGNEFTNKRQVVLHLVTPFPVEQMRISNMPIKKNDRFVKWEKFSSDIEWKLIGSDGLKTVYAQFKSKDGSVTDIYTGKIVLDTMKPFPGLIEINGGQLITNNPNVHVKIYAKDILSGIKDMQISNSRDFKNAEWKSYTTEFDWTLQSLEGKTQRIRHVYIKLRDKAGNVSPVLQGFIILKPI